ncbi:GntR family transcriptional regulator [Lacticaseibacillus hulanensis]|uniref:GntR family transcriptional regulator n=1 Tax=Lacticaseibacillus hulanensis TaxID=2493111 RepID=UPI000FDCDBC1|nr:GntR family transcriptional regulator [Lacticaseibacillus hulanensis]
MDPAELGHLAYYERLVLKIKEQIVRGVLQPGDKLPSVRDMARSEQLNPNTVAKAYKQLELDGVMEVQPGRGSFIAQRPRKMSQTEKVELKNRFDALVVTATAQGVDEATLKTWLAAHFEG